MRRKLHSSLPRLAAGAFLAWLFATFVLFTAHMSLMERPNRLGVLLTDGLTMLLMGLPALIAWPVLHHLGARLWVAVIVGGLAGGSETLLYAADAPPLVRAQMFGLATLLCGAATALVWWVAYPRKLQAAPLADAFA